MKAVKCHWDFLIHASNELRNDKEIVMAAIRKIENLYFKLPKKQQEELKELINKFNIVIKFNRTLNQRRNKHWICKKYYCKFWSDSAI